MKSNDKITLHKMHGCGFCDKALDMFFNDIQGGRIKVIEGPDGRSNITAFPTFTYNGKVVEGLPSSKEELFTKLGYDIVENYYRVTENYDNTIYDQEVFRNTPSNYFLPAYLVPSKDLAYAGVQYSSPSAICVQSKKPLTDSDGSPFQRYNNLGACVESNMNTTNGCPSCGGWQYT